VTSDHHVGMGRIVVAPDNLLIQNLALGRGFDAVEQISELLTPGSSLIISDYGISSETGPDTNFIVLTH
jgi:hypothetical protein